ncbi:glycosyltransferase family 2 protein [Steroidobacter agaridevorans]|uniref:glycosyltransferase family 2 protein n=1 Tax=Steroidobacter agaridevorans TaxID=2695856 RepID=UPI00137B4453|nr:glycosyltransferase family 2 protein [Steroidobacter agaridevorans]
MTTTSGLRLSICISTLNRAAFIGSSLDSIISQATDDCEIVVSDNASTDDTENVVADRARNFNRLRYVKQHSNDGADRNIDRVVELARGHYCWIFSDDDVMKPEAVRTVLSALEHDYCLILVNMEIKDASMQSTIRPRWINFDSDRVYGPSEADRMFAELDGTVVNLCNIIIKRRLWLSRDRKRYYGSNFIHAGIMFQAQLPEPAFVISTPLISYRLGNTQTFSSEWPEIWLSRWPALVRSLAISDSAKKQVRTSEPWRSPLWLLTLRGWEFYSLTNYRRWVRPRLSSINQRIVPMLIAALPCKLARRAASLCRVTRRFLGRQPATVFTRPM